MKQLKEKLILNEDDTQPEVIPAAELDQEPIPMDIPLDVPELEPRDTEELATNALVSIVNQAISDEWASIDRINSIITTFASEKPDATGAVEIFKQLIDEKTTHVGMLQKALEVIDGKTAALVQGGEEKADDIVVGAEEGHPETEKDKESFHDREHDEASVLG